MRIQQQNLQIFEAASKKSQALSEAEGSVRPLRALLIRRLLLAVAPSFCHYVQIAIEFN
jgi:hypothetical protein